MFRYFKHHKAQKMMRQEKAQSLYNEAVMQSRLPVFYKDLVVPDSIDGRFELLALHCYIIIHRLNEAGQPKLSQMLFDIFFISMDQSIREMGVGDVGVPKHMKRMMQGFNGRCQAYEIALKNNNKDELVEALKRNVYGTVEAPDDGVLSVLVDYIEQSIAMDATNAEFAAIDIEDNKESVSNA